MMTSEKLKLEQLRVKSFITVFDKRKEETLRGGGIRTLGDSDGDCRETFPPSSANN